MIWKIVTTNASLSVGVLFWEETTVQGTWPHRKEYCPSICWNVSQYTLLWIVGRTSGTGCGHGSVQQMAWQWHLSTTRGHQESYGSGKGELHSVWGRTACASNLPVLGKSGCASTGFQDLQQFGHVFSRMRVPLAIGVGAPWGPVLPNLLLPRLNYCCVFCAGYIWWQH